MADTPKRKGRPPGTPNPKAGRPPGAKNAKPAQGRSATEPVTIYLTPLQKEKLNQVCEFRGITQKQVLLDGIEYNHRDW